MVDIHVHFQTPHSLKNVQGIIFIYHLLLDASHVTWSLGFLYWLRIIFHGAEWILLALLTQYSVKETKKKKKMDGFGFLSELFRDHWESGKASSFGFIYEGSY